MSSIEPKVGNPEDVNVDVNRNVDLNPKMLDSSEVAKDDTKLDHTLSKAESAEAKLFQTKSDEVNPNIMSRRSHKSTEKGLAFKLQTFTATLKTQKNRVERQIDIINQCISTEEPPPNIDLVNNEVTSLEKMYGDLCDTYARAATVMSDDLIDCESEDYIAFNTSIEEAERKYFTVKSDICKWQMKQELTGVREDDRSSVGSKKSKGSSERSSKRSSHTGSSKSHSGSSHSSGSHRSKSSKRSTCSDKSNASDLSLKQRAKVEGLKAEAEAIVKTGEAELKVKQLRLQQKIAKEEAIGKVYQQEIAAEEIHPDDLQKTNKKKTSKPRMKSVRFPATATTDLQLAMMDMMKLQCAPPPDIDKFSGDPLEFHYFKTTFKEVVETTVPDQYGRLTRLIKFTSGDAKDLIKHCVHADPDSCYDKALLLLDKEYGNTHLVSSSYIKELRNWDTIKQHDSSAYKKFYRFLLKCQSYKVHGRLPELDSTDIIRTMISKTPVPHQEKWNRKASEIRKKSDREANFSDFVAFIENETALLSDPAYSRDALLEAKSKSYMSRLPSADKQKSVCHLCNSSHDIEDCDTFKAMDVDERHKTVFRLKLCFSCLEPVNSNHIAKTCDKKRKCSVCKSEHPTSLHGDKVNANLSSVGSQVISMCVTPVILYHRTNPSKRLTVYALLDDCSQGTFIHENTLHDLGVTCSQDAVIRINTLNGERQEKTTSIDGLVVESIPKHAAHYGDFTLDLPRTYSQPNLAVDSEEIPTPSKISPWAYLHHLQDKIVDYDPAVTIGLMIGANCPKAVESLEVIRSESGGPYAKRSPLGWCIVGPISKSDATDTINCNHTRLRIPVKDAASNDVAKHCFTSKCSVQDVSVDKFLTEMYTNEFNEIAAEKRALSVEDERFLSIMKEEAKIVRGHHQLPLPFRDPNLFLPNNRFQALNRLSSVKHKFLKDPEYKEKYVEKIETFLSKGYAKKADTSVSKPGKEWYAPHFGVLQKGKVRVVYDFSVNFKGRCLNDELLQGPDMTNTLVGVLARFRKEDIAFTADVEAMYHQVLVPEHQQSFLRFLWWPGGDVNCEPIDYEMQVHPFGAVSSGGCANFALKKTASDASREVNPEAIKTINKAFYVDDLLKSLHDLGVAKEVIFTVRNLCEQNGFNLIKFISNNRELLEAMPSDYRLPSVVNLDLGRPLPIERALGVQWCVENDAFQFRITLQDRPLTRRGILGTISSIYDPLGLASPFLLHGRKILQRIHKESCSWDDKVSDESRLAWTKWRDELPRLEELKVDRCYKPKGFKPVSASLHSFSDASDYGYGQASYLRQVDAEEKVCVSLVMGKSRVVPTKETTTPRLELTAGLVSAKVAAMLKEELDITNLSTMFWTDSTIVLGYIQNVTKRFRTYVANRVRKIHNLSQVVQWRHVDKDDNPSDDASRGLSVNDTEKVVRWFKGPQFLWNASISELGQTQAVVTIDDPEVIVDVKSNVAKLAEPVEHRSTLIKPMLYLDIFSTLENRVSSWRRMKLIVARILQLCSNTQNEHLTVSDLQEAENVIIKMVQTKHFPKEVSRLLNGDKLLKSSTIIRLDPFLDEDGLLRVGGRLHKQMVIDVKVKHPIILPKKDTTVKRIIEWHHADIQHLGRTGTLCELRSRGYWLVNGNSQVKSVVYKCFRCRLLRGQPATQKMSELPASRTTDAPPFTYCGVDMFGPFIIKEGRKEMKRFGMIYTCFSCRAVHLETAKGADTDSFILSLRRFVARRGPVRSVRSDNGGNFVGADNELRESLKHMDHEKVKNFLLSKDCDWITFEKNPPHASHMGGVWERQIRSIRTILASLLKTHATRLDDESLRTLFVEVEAVINSRPLAVETLSDESIEPLTPNHLLTMKSKVVLPPPGTFEEADVYCRKRWRAVQHLSNQFWDRWRKEYLVNLQERQKWTQAERNFIVDDIVLVKDPDAVRSKWAMGRVTEVIPSDDGLVRKAYVKTVTSEEPLLRPVTKLVLLTEGQPQS